MPRTVSSPAPRRKQATMPLWMVTAIGLTAIGVTIAIIWLMRPEWPQASTTPEPDQLPITVGGTLFNIPTQAIRMKIQRRSGAQDRIDLAFLYPSLRPPGTPAAITAETADAVPTDIDRIFVTIAAHGGAMSPDERLRTIYPRYLETQAKEAAPGLIRQPFRDTSPYRGEDLFGAPNTDFIARCSRDGSTPGMCLAERRVGGADMTFRFPREWLTQWQAVSQAIAQLTALNRAM